MYGQPQYQQQQSGRRFGTGGGGFGLPLAAGLGGGLLGGIMGASLMNDFDGGNQYAYQDGYQNGIMPSRNY
jgi:hypothetical protein